MSHALQRRLDRLFPLESETIWQDLRGASPSAFPPASARVVIIDLAFLVSEADTPPAPALLLDMDNGACMKDLVRSGADGMLCSPRLPLRRVIDLAFQARNWNYPCIFDCRGLDLTRLEKIRSLGVHGVLLTEAQPGASLFPRRAARLLPLP